jgi:hypothetical protein
MDDSTLKLTTRSHQGAILAGVLLVSLFCLGLGGTARAALDPDREEALQSQANDLMGRADWDRALPIFTELYAATLRAGYLWNAAVCQYNLARAGRAAPDAAIFVFRQYLEAPDAVEKKKRDALRSIEEMEALKKEMAAAAAASRPQPTPPAAHSPDLAAPNPGPKTIIAPPPAEPAPPNSSISEPTRASHGALRVGAIATGSAGLGATVAGVYFSLRTHSLDSQVTHAPQFSKSDDSAGESAHTLQFVMYGIGAAALATAGILYYLSSESPERSVALVPWGGDGAIGTSVGARF